MIMLKSLVVKSRGLGTMLLCKVVYITLFAFSYLICYAHNQFPNHLEPVKLSNIRRTPCWRQQNGCLTASPTTDYQHQLASSPDCANVILAPGSNKLICAPSLQSPTKNTLPITYTYPSDPPPSPLSAPQMEPNSIEKLVRSINRERNQKPVLIDTESRIDKKSEEQIQSTDQYYMTRNKAPSSYDTNIDDGSNIITGGLTEDNLEECNEPGDHWSETKRQDCLKKFISMKQNEHRRIMKKSNREDEPPKDYYLIERDGSDRDGDEVLSSLLMSELQSGSQQAAVAAATGRMPVVSLKSDYEILERLPGSEGGVRDGDVIAEERQVDLSEPAILIATRGLNYDQLRLKHPIIKLSHRNGGAKKRQQKQQTSVDLDGGERTNKSSLINQDTTTKTSMIRGESNEHYKSTIEHIANASKDSPLECNKRHYTFKALKRDEFGNKCTGIVRATVCYGGCDTGEIADWIFPHKKSVHKVCSHGLRVRRRVILTECTSNSVDPSLREYHYVDAKSCVCQKCNPADTTCLGSLTRPYLFTDELLLNGSGNGMTSTSNGIESTIPEASLI